MNTFSQRTDWAAPAVAGLPSTALTSSGAELGGFFTDLATGNGAGAMDRLVADGFSGGLKIAGATQQGSPSPYFPAVNTIDAGGSGKGPNWGLYAGLGAAAVAAVGLYLAWGR